MRVGGEKEIPVDIRVIAATNKNLKEEIENKNFREDLFHRLNVIPIHVPTLADRVDDIPLLANYFMEQICQISGKPVMVFEDEAIQKLQQIQWTGNIRELHNVIERLIILCDGNITGEDIQRYAMV